MTLAPPYPRHPDGRPSILLQTRNLKMARSAHAYVRGSTQKFYEWLETAEGRAVPGGPAVWVCGDCHVGNLGPVANADGRIAIQIRDLDQTVIGNPAHDLIRLGLSLAMAARGSDLPGVTTAKMLEQMTEGYCAALDDIAAGDVDDHRPESVRVVMRQATSRSWKKLAKERIEDARPTIPLGKKFWPMSPEERSAVAQLFDTERLRRLVTALRSRNDDAEVEMRDAAYWVKGCSSLGRLRFAVLLAVIGKQSRKGGLCLIDVKEASQAAAPRDGEVKTPRDNAERVVEGARHLSPYLGDRLLAERLLERSVFVRELLPQDLKLEIDELTCEEAMKVARYLASVVGKAHGRQMDPPTRRKWRTEVSRRSKQLDAPSWLWSSIVGLVASHEAAYLEHCRRYALETQAA